MSTEKDLFNSLKRNLPRVDWSRIETYTESGVPDVNYCFENGIEGWIELKIDIPRVKPSQVAWHTRAIANHRRAFILTLSIRTNVYHLFRTNQFRPVDSKHFTPNAPALMSETNLSLISSCLTATY